MKACIIRCSDTEFSLWQIFYTVRDLTKFKTHRSLSDECDGYLGDWISIQDPLTRPGVKLDEKMNICSSTPQHEGYTNSSLCCVSDNMSCHTILKYLYEPKMDVILTISFKITAEIEKSYFADEDLYRRFMKHNYVLSFIHCHGKYVYIVFFSLLLIAWLDHL